MKFAMDTLMMTILVTFIPTILMTVIPTTQKIEITTYQLQLKTKKLNTLKT
jgi:hypothetical protein